MTIPSKREDIEALKCDGVFEVQRCARCGEETIVTVETDDELLCLDCAAKVEEAAQEKVEEVAMKKSTYGMGTIFSRGGVLWIQLWHRGERHRESAHTTKKSEALALLKKRHEELGKGRTYREARKVTLTDLKALILADYKVNARRSTVRLEQCWKHLADFFGGQEPAVDIGSARVAAYVTKRTEQGGAAPATVRNELAALKRAFNLARKTGALMPGECPSFPSIRPSAPRAGFFEDEEFDSVLRHVEDDDVRDVLVFLRWTGWRVSEALGLQWKNVDLKVGSLRISTSKNSEPRTLPFRALPVLADLIQRRREKTTAAQMKRHKLIPFVFHRNGEAIRYFRRSWQTATRAAGVPGRLVHDLRRTAVRRLERAGVPRSVAMQITGHKTESIYRRYAIVCENDVAAGLAKLGEVSPTKTPEKVTPIKARKTG